MNFRLSRCGLFSVIFFSAATCALSQSPPTISKQPVSQSVSVGARVTLSATLSGDTPQQLVWTLNGAPLAGATNKSLLFTNVQLSHAGDYRLIASNAVGSVTSAIAKLDVDPTFTQITSTLFNVSGGSSGASWADYNNDGFLDLLILGKGSGGILCSNRGDGTFVKAAASGYTGDGLSAAWGDYNNDGWLDFVVMGANAIYLNQRNATFKRTTFSGGSTYCVGAADFDNDGALDFVAGNYYTGGNAFFARGSGTGTFTKITTGPVALDKSFSQGVSWADYDNDGRPDLFIANTSSQKALLYHNEGGAVFSKITNSVVTATASNFACGAWGDYDNDGLLDLFVCGYISKHLLFHNEGNGIFTTVTNAGAIITDAGDDQSAGWADYDNDGWLDLFVCSGGLNHGLKDFLYHNNHDGTFTRITTGSLANDNGEGAAAAWGDYDRDGFPDLFVTNWQNISTGDKSNFLYRNNGNSNRWLTIRCMGRASNGAAIGAKVRIRATIGGKEVNQLREISGGGAYVSQHSLEAMFGLGDATNVTNLRIEWPSGTVQEFSNVKPRQFLTIREPLKLGQLLRTNENFNLPIRSNGAQVILEVSTNLQSWLPFSAQRTNDQFTLRLEEIPSSKFFLRASERLP